MWGGEMPYHIRIWLFYEYPQQEFSMSTGLAFSTLNSIGGGAQMATEASRG